MRRIIADLFALALLIGGDAMWRAVAKSSSDALDFITLHITAIWIVWASLVGAGRAVIGIAMLHEKKSPALGVAEWALVFTGAHIVLCWLDTIWEPHDTFQTVLAFTFLTLF